MCVCVTCRVCETFSSRWEGGVRGNWRRRRAETAAWLRCEEERVLRGYALEEVSFDDQLRSALERVEARAGGGASRNQVQYNDLAG